MFSALNLPVTFMLSHEVDTEVDVHVDVLVDIKFCGCAILGSVISGKSCAFDIDFDTFGNIKGTLFSEILVLNISVSFKVSSSSDNLIACTALVNSAYSRQWDIKI